MYLGILFIVSPLQKKVTLMTDWVSEESANKFIEEPYS